MRGINKQKFLTELGRLLTLMSEEDRERALAMYSSLFDETDDETGVLQMLVSPTRQAVNLARAYDARARKLEVHAQARGEEPETEEPAFVRVIENLRAQAAELGMHVNTVPEDQLSLFEAAAEESAIFDEAEPVEGDEAENAPLPDSHAEEPVPVPEDAETPPEAEEPAGDDSGESAEDPGQEESTEVLSEDEPAPAENDISEPAPEEPEDSVPEAEPAPQSETQAPFADGEKAEEAAFPEWENAPIPETHDSQIRAGERPVFTRSKARVPLLILFLLIAVPVTLLCVVLLLIPAAVTLCGGLFAGWLGFSGLFATFGSFSVFADILLVFGCTLIVLALAVLLLWIFIWLIGGAIPGLIRGVCALARKWCYKEVPVT